MSLPLQAMRDEAAKEACMNGVSNGMLQLSYIDSEEYLRSECKREILEWLITSVPVKDYVSMCRSCA
jgi:hypothetical protein